MRQAKLPARERYVLDALLSRADNATCEIPARFQPRSHGDEYFFGAPRRTVQRALDHLRQHHWVDWQPASQGKRGRPPNLLHGQRRLALQLPDHGTDKAPP